MWREWKKQPIWVIGVQEYRKLGGWDVHFVWLPAYPMNACSMYRINFNQFFYLPKSPNGSRGSSAEHRLSICVDIFYVLSSCIASKISEKDRSFINNSHQRQRFVQFYIFSPVFTPFLRIDFNFISFFMHCCSEQKLLCSSVFQHFTCHQHFTAHRKT